MVAANSLEMFLVVVISLLLQVQSMSLSPIESMLFKSRLSSIRQDIRSKLTNAPKMPTSKGIDAVFIFPGAGGADSLTEELEERIKQCDAEAGIKGRWISTIDWKEHRGSVVTAAFDGEAVGKAVADSISTLQPRSVHCIGISVGAFCAHSMAETLSKLQEKPHIRLTLLDPFCSRGLLGIGYGAKNYGVNADYAEQYLNTDDPVPTTNDPLPNCYCVDVTKAPERQSFLLPPQETMHCWPVAYYAKYGYQSKTDDDGRIAFFKHDETHERGTVLQLQ